MKRCHHRAIPPFKIKLLTSAHVAQVGALRGSSKQLAGPSTIFATEPTRPTLQSRNMPRENSFTDSERRSLTPELERDVLSPLSPAHQQPFDPYKIRTASRKSQISNALQSPVRTVTWQNLTPKEKFRASVNKVIALQRGLSLSVLTVNDSGMYVGAEPGVDCRHISAEATYGGMIHPCRIEIVDYSAIRKIHRVMSNDEFIDLMDTGSHGPPQKPPWAKVRWINICGLSWDVMKAVSIAYG